MQYPVMNIPVMRNPAMHEQDLNLLLKNFAKMEIFKTNPSQGVTQKKILGNQYGYCMMIIKATNGIIPNNYKGVYFILEHGEVVDWPNGIKGSARRDVSKLVQICLQNYTYIPLGVLDHATSIFAKYLESK